MKADNGSHFEPAYNAQASVEVSSRLMVGESVTNQAKDKQPLVPAVESGRANGSPVAAVLVDRGFYSEAAVQPVETTEADQLSGTTVYAAVEKTSHHCTGEDLEPKETPGTPGPEAGANVILAHRLHTPEGKALYGLRKEPVEPVLGIIKEVMGFRRFSPRGKAKVALEWTLVTLSYNLRRLPTVLQSRTKAVGVSQKSPKGSPLVGKERVIVFGVVPRFWGCWSNMAAGRILSFREGFGNPYRCPIFPRCYYHGLGRPIPKSDRRLVQRGTVVTVK